MKKEVARIRWKISNAKMKAELYRDLIELLEHYYLKSRWQSRGRAAANAYANVLKMLKTKEKLALLSVKLNEEKLLEMGEKDEQ